MREGTLGRERALTADRHANRAARDAAKPARTRLHGWWLALAVLALWAPRISAKELPEATQIDSVLAQADRMGIFTGNVAILGGGDGGIYSTTADLLALDHSLATDTPLLPDSMKLALVNEPVLHEQFAS